MKKGKRNEQLNHYHNYITKTTNMREDKKEFLPQTAQSNSINTNTITDKNENSDEKHYDLLCFLKTDFICNRKSCKKANYAAITITWGRKIQRLHGGRKIHRRATATTTWTSRNIANCLNYPH